MSYLYEMLLSQEVLKMSSLSVNTQLNTTLHVSDGGCQNLWCHQSSVSTAGFGRQTVQQTSSGNS
jgi:hypothetical protein